MNDPIKFDHASDYAAFRQLWMAGTRDRETSLQLMFLAWWHWAEPPFLTGLADDPTAAGLWRAVFLHLGGEESNDAEFLFVASRMAKLFPWALGDEQEWLARAIALADRAHELHPSSFEPALFVGRGAYGDYFSRLVGTKRRLKGARDV